MDDAILAVAIILLSTSAGLYLSLVDDMYLAEALVLGISPDIDQATIIPRLLRLHKLTDAFLILTWASFNSVKFSFLLFFRSFTAHPGLQNLGRYWWMVTVFTAISWVSGSVLEVIECPYFDERSCEWTFLVFNIICWLISSALCTRDNVPEDGGNFHLDYCDEHHLGSSQSVLPIYPIYQLTCYVVISIPVIILSKISVSLRKKTYLALSLCLSVATVCTTIVRIVGLKVPGIKSIDIVWEVYWQFIEACVGVMVVSMMTFRTFFVQRAIKAKRASPRVLFSRMYRRTFRRNYQNDVELPNESFPHPTMTGVKTFIDGAGKSTQESKSSDSKVVSEFDEGRFSLHENASSQVPV